MSIALRIAKRFLSNRPARVIESGGAPYLYRVFLFRVWGWNCYLHHFVSRDAERWLHDHPFDGVSFVLAGEYIEERLVGLSWPDTMTETRRISAFNRIAGTTFHRILEAAPDTLTIFLHGPKWKGWGFIEPCGEGQVYRNPFGNVGDRPWWLTARTYGELTR